MNQNSRYHEEPLLGDVKQIAAAWLALPKGSRVDLAVADQAQYNQGQPYLAPMRAVGFLVEMKELKRVGPRREGFGFREPGVYVFERIGSSRMMDLPWGILGGPCPACGVEFLWYGLNGHARKYCTPKHAAVAKTRRARRRESEGV